MATDVANLRYPKNMRFSTITSSYFCVKLPFGIGDTPRLHTNTVYIIILYSQLKENILSTIRRKCCYFTKETVFSKDVSDVNYI